MLRVGEWVGEWMGEWVRVLGDWKHPTAAPLVFFFFFFSFFFCLFLPVDAQHAPWLRTQYVAQEGACVVLRGGFLPLYFTSGEAVPILCTR